MFKKTQHKLGDRVKIVHVNVKEPLYSFYIGKHGIVVRQVLGFVKTLLLYEVKVCEKYFVSLQPRDLTLVSRRKI